MSITTWDSKRKKWIVMDSRPPTMLLCQMQEVPEEGGFFPREVGIGRYLCDTGAQVNLAGPKMLKRLLGLSPAEMRRVLIDSEVTIKGVGGSISMAKELECEFIH